MRTTVAIGGPTGSGKSSIALALAGLINGEIVSCDSMQIYRGLDIGTAKDTPEERKAVAHWLLDIRDPDERYSVAEYVEDARAAISDIESRGKTAIICGGTGLYMSALLAGTSFSAEHTRDDHVRDEITRKLELLGPEKLIDEIAEADPEYAGKLFANDTKRIVRALEIIRGGSTPSALNEASLGDRLPCLGILVDCSERSVLYKRIESRCDRMISEGILEEAKYVYENRSSFETAAAAIGYKEFFPYFEGTKNINECLDELKKATRHYAKRQLTWFRGHETFTRICSDLMDSDEAAGVIYEMWKKGADQ